MSDTSQTAIRLAAIFDDRDQATRFVERLVEEDFPMDQISLLHKGGGHGDDPIGIVYRDERERIRVWGEQGALWGALGGLLAGLSGVFLVPGVGAVLAAGPITEALLGALTGAGLMAGAAGLTALTHALRQAGVPEEHIEQLRQAIEEGRYVLLLHTTEEEAKRLENQLLLLGASVVHL